MGQRLRRRIAILGVTALVALLPSVEARAERRTWTVAAGDVLGTIAERAGVTVEQLRDWNGLPSDLIQVGQEIFVAPDPGPDAPAPEGTYVVASGDTLSGIAQRLAVPMDQVLTWNPGVSPDRIRVGQALRVGSALRRVSYRVLGGDTLSAIATDHGATVAQLRRWNPRLSRDRIRAGQSLLVYTEQPESLSESVGAPDHGRLAQGVQVPPHAGYEIRDPDAAWGTRETVGALVDGFAAVLRAHPDAPRVRLHDVSSHEGGFMSGHRSHQSGRDVDLSYYQRRCGERPCPFGRVSAGFMDATLQWTLLEHWLREGHVDAIFIDHELQAPLYNEARSRGATRAELHRWFQYPRDTDFPLGTIRHYPKHDDHLHVRFSCHRSDPECR